MLWVAFLSLLVVARGGSIPDVHDASLSDGRQAYLTQVPVTTTTTTATATTTATTTTAATTTTTTTTY